METNGASEVPVSSTSEDCSETTVEIKIKTLDSQTYTLRVNKSMPVPALKEQIANVTGVLSEQQRLICRGKVLKDDQLLSAYHVEDGHTLHLVVRQPLSSSTTSSMGPESAPLQPETNPTSSTTRNHNGSMGHSVVFGTVNLADQGDSTSELSRVISGIIGSLGIGNFGTGGERVDPLSSERPEGASGNIGISDPAQSQSNQSTARAEINSQQNAFRSPGPDPTVIPDALTTLYQYLNHMKDEFNANVGGHSSNAQNGEAQGQSAHLHSPLGQGGLPTPASLAEVLLSARQLLIEHAGGCLSELARQLEGQTSVTDPLTRRDIQSNSIRSGILFQNLGSLLLELGRATTTLRMGQTSSEAMVNAGPAIFISSSGPNPLMVQAGTTFGGIPMGSVNPFHGLAGGTLGSGFLSRNIDIRIRRGHSVPVATSNSGDQAGVRQPLGLTDPARTPGDNPSHQAFQGVSATASISGEPGVRVVPVRTVVAVPAGASHHPSNSAGSAVGLFYPLLARFQQQNPRNLNDARSSQVSVGQHSVSGTGQQQIPDLTAQPQNLESTTTSASRDASLLFTNAESAQHQQETSRIFDSSRQGPLDGSNNDGTQTHEGQQSGQEALSQMYSRVGQIFRTILPGEQIQINDISLQTTATGTSSGVDERSTATDGEAQVGNDGVFFSGLVRQLMPLISQSMTETPGVLPGAPSSSMEQTEGQNATDARSSQDRRDPPAAPDSKRPKRE